MRLANGAQVRNHARGEGRVFFFLSKILDVLLSPLTWGLVLVAFGVQWRRPITTRWRRWSPVAGIAVLVVFSMEPVANALWRSLEASAVRTVREGVTYDAVVLLGGVVNDRAMTGPRDAPSYNDNVERLLVTYELLRTGRARNAIISGGDPGAPAGAAVEARVLAEQLASWGIARERLVIEDRARNTRENAVYVASIVRARAWNHVVIVTSAFHMHRSIGCFRAVDLAVDTLPVDQRSYDPARHGGALLPRADALHASAAVVREWSGRIVYQLRGYSRGH